MNCPTCGNILEGRTYDYGCSSETGYHDAGEYDYCDYCHKAVDEGDSIEDGPEAEALRERNEETIGDRQYAVWLERKEREIAILKACRPEMCAVDDSDLDRLAEVLRG